VVVQVSRLRRVLRRTRPPLELVVLVSTVPRRSPSLDVILNFTPTGMLPTKELTPHVPISVDEIVEDVHRATEIGITTVHLHARNELTERPTYMREVYKRLISSIRAFDRELVIGVSLSGRGFVEFEQRAAPLQLDGELKPDMGSLTLSSLNFNRDAAMNSPEMIQALAAEMLKKGIVPELEAFDAGMINYAKYLTRKGLLQPPLYFNLLLGNIACAQADMLHAGVMVNDLPEGSYWSLAGIGNAQLQVNSLAIAFGGGARVGLEDNVWYDVERTRLATNADLLERVHRLVDVHGRRVMSPRRFRELMNIGGGNGEYGRPPVPGPPV
jgi:3-keto-5-aminohexanoate cleavage enzyme